jgi:hypothetical protein
VTRTLSLVEAVRVRVRPARHVVVTDLYLAGEANPDGVTGEVIADALMRRDPGLDTLYCGDSISSANCSSTSSTDSDVILFFGAGDVGSVIATLPGGTDVNVIEAARTSRGIACAEHAPLGARTTYRVGGTARVVGHPVVDRGRVRGALGTADDGHADW